MGNYLRPMEPAERGQLCQIHDEDNGFEVEADATHWLVDHDPRFPFPVAVCLACGTDQLVMDGQEPSAP